MAIDSAAKRRAIMGVPFGIILNPIGSINASQRFAFLGVYLFGNTINAARSIIININKSTVLVKKRDNIVEIRISK